MGFYVSNVTIIWHICSAKKHRIHTHKHKWIYAQWNGPSETKPNPQNCKNCSFKCAYDCAQLQNTIQHRTVLISPLLPPGNHHNSDVVYWRKRGHVTWATRSNTFISSGRHSSSIKSTAILHRQVRQSIRHEITFVTVKELEIISSCEITYRTTSSIWFR